jgi:hypothetical protein
VLEVGVADNPVGVLGGVVSPPPPAEVVALDVFE